MTEEMETKEVSVVKQQATKALGAAQELEIADDEGMVGATDLLSKMKSVAKMIKERKEQITRPLMEALESARGLFKPIETNLAEAERVVKTKMLAYNAEQDRKAEAERLKLAKRVEKGIMKPETAVAKMEAIQAAPANVQGKTGAMAFRTIKKYRVTDESKLPREYLMPDTAKINEALKAGKEVPGAEAYEEKIVASSRQLEADSPLLGHKQR